MTLFSSLFLTLHTCDIICLHISTYGTCFIVVKKKIFLSRCIQMKRNKSSLHRQPTIFYLFSEESKLGSKTKHQYLRRAVGYD